MYRWILGLFTVLKILYKVHSQMDLNKVIFIWIQWLCVCTHIQFSVNIYFKIIGLTRAFLHHLKQNHHLKPCFLVFTCPVQFLALWRASFPRFACSLKTICDPPCLPHSLYGENTHITNKTYSKIWLLIRVTQLLFFPMHYNFTKLGWENVRGRINAWARQSGKNSFLFHVGFYSTWLIILRSLADNV